MASIIGWCLCIQIVSKGFDFYTNFLKAELWHSLSYNLLTPYALNNGTITGCWQHSCQQWTKPDRFLLIAWIPLLCSEPMHAHAPTPLHSITTHRKARGTSFSLLNLKDKTDFYVLFHSRKGMQGLINQFGWKI